MKKLFVLFLFTISIVALNAQSPCRFQYGANEADSLKCVEEITSFRTFYDQKSYKDAYPHWRYIVNQCPCSWNGVFVYAQTMFDALIQSCGKDSALQAQKENFIDSLLWSYEMRPVFFPDKYTEGNGLGFKAYNTMRYRSNKKENVIQAYEWFTRSVDLEKENTQPNIWDIFFKTAEFMTQQTKDTTIIIESYERATEYIDIAINNAYKQYEKVLPFFDNLDSAFKMDLINQYEFNNRLNSLQADTARQMKLVSNYRKTISNIEGTFTPYAPCSVLEKVYGKKIEAGKNDLQAIKKIVLIMSKDAECIKSPVFVSALEILHQSEPSAQSAYLMGNFSMQNGELDKAIDYFKQAIDMFETNEQKVMPYYMMGLAHQLKGNRSEARLMALQALRIKPDFGKAYILIGDLYAASVGSCGSELPYSASFVAADKYSRAAAVDASVRDEANNKRARLVFPTVGDATMRGYHEGDPITVTCWINESSTVRGLRK
ncbi:MAG: tetratricopeptide repeat protein [Bacteroidales bacterium]|jgi:tetratricopeptide (TPR) repeat protein|nr:tetratricopeptide repeat protein [Bacteroidales bacterium]